MLLLQRYIANRILSGWTVNVNAGFYLVFQYLSSLWEEVQVRLCAAFIDLFLQILTIFKGALHNFLRAFILVILRLYSRKKKKKE